MNKAVLVSISPKWCEKIASGEKTVEVRKTHPKIETPFKCYIYCTKARNKNDDIWGDAPLKTVWHYGVPCVEYADGMPYLNGCVIGEFVCNKIYDIKTPKDYFSEYLFFAHHGKSPEGSQDLDANKLLKETCLSMDDMIEYANGKELFGWRIADLKIYNKPKAPGEFRKPCELFKKNVCGLRTLCGEQKGVCDGTRKLTKPPQSWCYVEELGGEKK